MSKVWRLSVDGLVVILFVYTFAPFFIGSFIPYEDTVTPDETKLLDLEISDFLEENPRDFQEKISNPEPLSEYDFVYLNSRRSLAPSYNYLQNKESVVYISSEGLLNMYFGAGTILSADGVIMTNYHIIDGAERVAVTTHSGEHYIVEKVLAYDKNKDVAFLKISAEDLRPMPIGDDTQVAVGEETMVIGHPEGFLFTLSHGMLSGRRNYDSIGEGNMLQINNAISGGNSGGAILNQYGELIGIPTATVEYESNSVQVQNVNLAVPISEALKVLGS